MWFGIHNFQHVTQMYAHVYTFAVGHQPTQGRRKNKFIVPYAYSCLLSIKPVDIHVMRNELKL